MTLTISTLEIEAATTDIASTGQKLMIINRVNGEEYPITLTAPIETGDKDIYFTAITTESLIILGSIIILPQDEKWNKINTNFNSRHASFTFPIDSRTVTNDFLSRSYDAIFTTNTGTVVVDGNNYDNSWAGVYSILNQTRSNFIIHRIRGNVVTNLNTGNSVKMKFYKKSFTVGNTTQTPMKLVDNQTFTSVADIEHGFEYDSGDISANANSSFSSIDNLIPVLQLASTTTGKFLFHAEIEIIFSNTY